MTKDRFLMFIGKAYFAKKKIYTFVKQSNEVLRISLFHNSKHAF